MAELSHERILQNFREKRCEACGNNKTPRMSFCRPCYYMLPPDTLRKSLWRRFGDGYEEAFNECLAWLKVERKKLFDAAVERLG